MMYARIQDNVVAELFTPPDGVTLADCFTGEIAALFVEVPEGATVEPGWSFENGSFAPSTSGEPPAAEKSPRISSTQFLNRFPPGTLTALAANPQTLVLLITCAAATSIDLTDPAVQGGINSLVPTVLTAEQAAAILDH